TPGRRGPWRPRRAAVSRGRRARAARPCPGPAAARIAGKSCCIFMQCDAYFFGGQERGGGQAMGMRVAVAGASGYAGGELLRLLAGHPDFEIGAVTGASSAGKPVTAVHPNLTGHPAFDGREFEPTTAQTLRGAELIFMALPHGESAALAGQ